MGGMDKGDKRVGDYGTPEQEIPATGFGPGVDWESCMTMNDTWGFKKNDHNWKSSATLIRNLVDCASKGGNYLLNIGPTAEGLFPQASIERLAEIGRWMKANNESIYATTASPFKRLPWGRCTQKSGALVSALASPKHTSLSSATVRNATTLYLHVFDWPADGKLLVPGLKNQAQKACLLAGPNRKVAPLERTNKGLTISLPPTAPDPVSSTVVLVIQGAPDVEEPGLVQAADGSALLSASEARLHGAGLRYESGQQRDNLGYWSNPDDWADWEIKITKPGKFEVSAETAAPEPASFEISAGAGKLQAAAPVTGDYGNFKLTRLGILQIPSAGKITIAVRPIKANWHPINLKALRLKPVPANP